MRMRARLAVPLRVSLCLVREHAQGVPHRRETILRRPWRGGERGGQAAFVKARIRPRTPARPAIGAGHAQTAEASAFAVLCRGASLDVTRNIRCEMGPVTAARRPQGVSNYLLSVVSYTSASGILMMALLRRGHRTSRRPQAAPPRLEPAVIGTRSRVSHRRTPARRG